MSTTQPSTRPVSRAFQLQPEQGEPIPVIVTLHPDASLSIRRRYGRVEQRIPLLTLLASPSQPLSAPRRRSKNWPFIDEEVPIGIPEAAR